MNAWLGRYAAVWVAFVFVSGGFGGGWLESAWAGKSQRPAMSHGTTAMKHGGMEVGDTPTPPTVKLTVRKDAKAGWNLQTQVTNFRFAPEHASTAHVPGEGHAHLYIDGKKVTRLYGEWYHIPSLSPGTHKITVTLNANSHEDLMVKGKVVSDKQEVRVSAK